MTEHLCVICQSRYSGGYADPGCLRRLDHTLVEIETLTALLPALLEPGRAGGQKVGGSRSAPLPLQVDPLDLSLPTGKRRVATITDPHLDQLGHVPVAVELDTWVREWHESGASDHLPSATVTGMVGWLRNHLDWASREHAAVDEFNTAMWQLLQRLRRVHGIARAPKEHVDIPCRRLTCSWMSLYRYPDSPDPSRVYCENPDCQAVYTAAEFQQWCELLASWPVA